MSELIKIWIVLIIILSICCYLKPKDEIEMTGGGGFHSGQFMSVDGMYRTRVPHSGTTRCFSCELELLGERGLSPYFWPLPY